MVAADEYKFDVFIAFAPEDSVTQRAVRRHLGELGVRTDAVYGATALDFHPEQSDLCRNFLLLATPSSASSPYVREHVDHWRKHRGMRMRASFYILDISGDTLRSSHTATRGWYDLLDFAPGDPLDRQIAAIWPGDTLGDSFHAKSLAFVLTAGRTPRPALSKPTIAPLPAPKAHRPQPRTFLATLFGILLLALLATAWLSTRSLLESHQHDGLGPTDAPAAVASIVSIGTVIGVLIGGILNGLAKLIQARGQRDADLVRANAEMVRAEADMIRAKAGRPPTDTPTPAALPSPDL